jgi:hypothetical protein
LEGPDLIFTIGSLKDAAKKLERIFASAPGRVTLLDEKTVYWRPPEKYLDEPGTMLAVLRKLLVRPIRQPKPGNT